ncbi:hypothetical protein PAMC26510_17005 [Caballeronia sordidicola]|uniref:Uncharacterized protein n=1 Tax=Caballeronia sordidicola TaxID=196367 RepID=A0A242MSF2_CABSO|nr:hypothetical protein PAMC26510_17005 [Caballeronia sordidicola]
MIAFIAQNNIGAMPDHFFNYLGGAFRREVAAGFRHRLIFKTF